MQIKQKQTDFEIETARGRNKQPKQHQKTKCLTVNGQQNTFHNLISRGKSVQRTTMTKTKTTKRGCENFRKFIC